MTTTLTLGEHDVLAIRPYADHPTRCLCADCGKDKPGFRHPNRTPLVAVWLDDGRQLAVRRDWLRERHGGPGTVNDLTLCSLAEVRAITRGWPRASSEPGDVVVAAFAQAALEQGRLAEACGREAAVLGF